MKSLLEIVFWTSLVMILHSYLLYPFILKLLSMGKQLKADVYLESDLLPDVYIVLAAFNEESVIKDKMESMLNSIYPGKIEFHIGSDASTDFTDEIIQEFEKSDRRIVFRRFERMGKANILNEIVKEIVRKPDYELNSVFVFTDANVIFEKNTVFNLLRHFKSTKIGQVAANIINKKVADEGISKQEKFYISHENILKYREGIVWGTMMGAFGACYALRADQFVTIPSNFLMEDFYLSMKVLENKMQAISDLEAICYEDLPNESREEFKRKKRISAGNFQNLSVYYKLIWPPYKGLGFAFISHKLIRWIGPFLLFLIYVSSGILALGNILYATLFLLMNAMLFLGLIDLLLKKIGIHSLFLRFISYFIQMNLALLLGFFKYIRGIKSNVWQPTKRHEQ